VTWLERVRSLLRREPVPDEHRATIKRADALLSRAHKVLHPELASYRRVHLR
jgi:hypothetical protein